MHCLGAVAGGQQQQQQGSPSGFNSSRGSVHSVVRALGVLVCEGRIQGPPRGYKEGPHCVPPLHSAPNNHECEKDNYLCDRYLVLVREITERVSLGAYLCVEVVLCSDCPCGLIKSKSKHRVLSVAPALPSWQHASEMLLEYWCIGVVPSKNPETMNCQGLYQAVRSRLHFSQVAAWWSRTNGARPSYIATRIVPQPGLPDDHLRRFREPPVEHTFPLAGLGDGNSIKVTVWALPRMEDIPHLQCSMHPEDSGTQQARPATPVKRLIPTTAPLISINTPTGTPPSLTSLNNNNNNSQSNHNNNNINALHQQQQLQQQQQQQTSNSPVGSVTSGSPSGNHTSAQQANNQQQQQPQQPTFVYYMSSFRTEAPQAGLLDDRLQIACDKPGKHHCRCAEEEDELEDASSGPSVAAVASAVRPNGERKRRRSLPCRPPEPSSPEAAPAAQLAPAVLQSSLPVLQEAEVPSALNNPRPAAERSPAGRSEHSPTGGLVDGLERKFRTQLSIDADQHLEKRYKRSVSVDAEQQQAKQPAEPCPSDPGADATLGLAEASREHTINLVVNPMYINELQRPEPARKVKGGSARTITGLNEHRHLDRLMSKLSFPQEKECKPEQQPHQAQQQQQQLQSTGGAILDWISRVPGRVLAAEQQQQQQTMTTTPTVAPAKCEIKIRNNCNLELSPREFDEVLAVLRARTPLSRKRSAVRTAKRKDKYERLLNEPQPSQQHQQQQQQSQVTNKPIVSKEPQKSKAADLLLGAILKSSSKESGRDEVITEVGMTTAGSPVKDEELEEPEKEPATGGSSSDVGGAADVGPELDCSSLPSALNKRLSRLRQLFKRPERERRSKPDDYPDRRNSRPKQTPVESRVKRRIDFASELVDDEENTGDDELGEEDDEDEEQDEEDGRPHCESSSLGASTNSAHLIYHSTKNEMRAGTTANGSAKEQCRFDRTELMSKKSRVRHELSPILIKHNTKINGINGNNNNNNNNNSLSSNKNIVAAVPSESQVKPDASAEESESGTEVEQDGIELCDRTAVPSAKDQARFRRSLENAASMVFHSRTGLPLTSSPAPLRRGSCCFDFDSSLNSVSSKRSALFELNTPPSPGAVSLEEGDRETECTGDLEEVQKRRSSSRNRPQSHALLGSFEESALNGRLEPVSTVHGFTAEIGASGTFCPKHRKLPVTVFFYTLGDNDKVSSPYLAHINLGKKAYQVPRVGTIQVTLLNPLGTVVKMFVVLYDLGDMPPRSHTFLRQRTLRDKTLRYLIHLRFMSGKTGRIYLHTDVRMIICRKADVDTASDFGSEPPKELRSYTHGPTNPKFSPRC